ncbi:hypothetical protein BGZ83_007237 [Gryganskiella cystojenkinii]|nr:hypothetical protein BGZ83_007237 [Gryganskiella cystojenkinii]
MPSSLSLNEMAIPLQPVINSVTVSAPVPATAAAVLTGPTTSTPTSSSEDSDIWLRRFQQLQQLQQQHHLQQHQLLSSTLSSSLRAPTLSSSELISKTTPQSSRSQQHHRSRSSERSVSPAASSSSSSSQREKGEKGDAIYPSPPLQDDMFMDSDSEDRPLNGNDPLNPTPSQLKMMTSKERRQLRNKLSARNFRVRRKEYIGTLENQVKEARKEAADLQRRLIQSELNCQFLRQELETARLSQSLFTDGRMSKEHANLLASLLNPLTETFPTTSATLNSNSSVINTNSGGSSSGGSSSNSNPQPPITMPMSMPLQIPIQVAPSQGQQSLSWLDTALMNSTQGFGNNNNSSTIQDSNMMSLPTVTASSFSNTTAPQASMQPFVPFEGDWGLLINRAEVPDSNLDPKEESDESDAAYKDLLSRYEAAKKEEELDEQMRAELKAYSRKRLEETYVVMPKDETTAAIQTIDKQSIEETLMLQSLVYMMMLHLTRSLFEAATLSKSELVNMYQIMDEPLREKMILRQLNDQANLQDGGLDQFNNKFSEWREAWIRKCWPSFYNNRRRLTELFKSGHAAICSPSACSITSKGKQSQRTRQELDVVEVARKMEEGVSGKMVPVPKVSWFVRHYLPTFLKCPEILERERLEDEARVKARSQKDKLASVLAKTASNVTPVA